MKKKSKEKKNIIKNVIKTTNYMQMESTTLDNEIESIRK